MTMTRNILTIEELSDCQLRSHHRVLGSWIFAGGSMVLSMVS